MKKLIYGENDCTNSEYHSDKLWLNSSALKYLIHGWDYYITNYLNKNNEIKTNPNLEVGSLMHSLLLEPHNTNRDFGIYKGPIRRGSRFESFKNENPNKIIITHSQFQKVNEIIDFFKRGKSYYRNIKLGKKEHTVCSIINGIKVKARFDSIDIKNGQIYDLKSTRYSKEEFGLFFYQAKQLQYNLSAALYIEVAKSFYKKDFEFTIIALNKKSGEHFYLPYKYYEDVLKSGYDNMHKALDNYKNRRNYE